MKKTILVAIAMAVVAPLLAIGGARTGASVDMKCDTMTISADSLLKETPLFDRLYLDAVCRQIAGDSTASALLERCHEMRPDAAEVYYSLAHSYLKQGNDSLARVNMRRAAELQPDNDNYLENVAETYIDQREYDRAIEAYEQLYAHHRDRSDVLELLVRLYNAKKDYPKMLSTIDRMEQADGPSEEISLMRMGIYEQQGDKKNAYRILHALTNDHPNEPSYKVMLGNWLMQHDRKSEAYNWFKSALEDDKQNELH
jgi:Flp pilus assembly protein TadD